MSSYNFLSIFSFIFFILSPIFGQYLFIPQVPRYASRRMRMADDFITQQNYFSPSPMAYPMNRQMGNPSFQSTYSYPQNTFSPDFQPPNQHSQQFMPMTKQDLQETLYQNPNTIQFDSPLYQKEMAHNEMMGPNQRNNKMDESFSQQMNQQMYQPMYIDKNEKLDINFPKFLEDTDQEVVNEFLRIISLKNETYSRKQQKLDKLVSTLDDSHQKLYKDYVLTKDAEEQNYRSKVDAQVGTMSKDAQEKFNQISSILTNIQIPDNEKWDRVMEIYNTLSNELKEEFEKKFEGFKA